MIKRIVSIIVLFSFFSACKKPSQPTPMNGLTTDVYVAGVTSTQALNYACYWKNDTAIILGPAGVNSYASDIAVLNNDVYVAGYLEQVLGSTIKPAIWKNGVLKVLSQTAGYTSSTTVHNGIVYAVGEFINATGQSRAFLWNSGTETLVELNSSNIKADAYNISYYSGEQIVTGHINNQAAFWINGNPTTITDPNFASSNIGGVVVSGGAYYFSGSRQPTGTGGRQYGFWKHTNGTSTFTNYSTFGMQSTINPIALKSDTLFIVGKTTSGTAAALTKVNISNNNHTTIPVVSLNVDATDILIDTNDTYILLREYSGGGLKASYWKNGQIKMLETKSGYVHSNPYGIFIHKY